MQRYLQGCLYDCVRLVQVRAGKAEFYVVLKYLNIIIWE